MVSTESSVSTEDTPDDNQQHHTAANDSLTPEQRKQKKIYYVAREIMSSEKVFVEVLRLINVEFRQFVEEKIQVSFKFLLRN